MSTLITIIFEASLTLFATRDFRHAICTLVQSSDLSFWLSIGCKYIQRIHLQQDLLATNTARSNHDIIVPESVGITTIALPAKVHAANLRLDAAPRPALRIRVTRRRQTSKGRIV